MKKTVQEKAQLIVTAANIVCDTKTWGELQEVLLYILQHGEEYTAPKPNNSSKKEDKSNGR